MGKKTTYCSPFNAIIMEVLLLEDVNGIGKKNDLLIVGDGFALNCLLPQRKALVATPTVRRRYADQIRKRAEEKEKDRARQTAVASAIAGKTVEFTRKVTKTGKLYAAITEENVAEAMRDQHNVDVAIEDIDIPEPIKAAGSFNIKVKIGTVAQTVSVAVKAEK
ncbi:MAG: large subunit ribosomal protein [Candidatus Peribacteria bacterium]|nr:large subunit ribosomal protein [Candidatus Peribacteria bacterium]